MAAERSVAMRTLRVAGFGLLAFAITIFAGADADDGNMNVPGHFLSEKSRNFFEYQPKATSFFEKSGILF